MAQRIEGADEVLAGYSAYQKMLLMDRFRRIPGAALAARLAQPAAGRKLRRYLGWFRKPLRDRYRGVSTLFAEDELENLLVPELQSTANWNGVEDTYFDRSAGLDTLSQMLYFDLKVWLPDDLLIKADKMSMASSLELRVPFLDHKIVEWTWQLPSHLKLHAGTGKRLLKQAVGGLIPAPILTRAKLGFPVPIQSWFQGELARTARDLLLDRTGACSHFFDTGEVEALIARHERGGEDLSGEIYALVVFALWYRVFIESPSVTTAPPPLAAVGEWAA